MPRHQMDSPLRSTLVTAIRQFDLCRPGDCIIVAVSGGADSVALLDLLATLPDFPLHLVVAHLNHGLRGSESDQDELLVRQLAAQYGLACETEQSEVRVLARQLRCSLEDAGRTARYAFFQRLRSNLQANAIAVGHHRDDQAETFLIRLLRGSGTTGLASMAPRTATGIIRPLLNISRQELQRYCAERQLPFREDSSNSDQTFLRNRIRHQLLPLLAGYNPSISQQLATTAHLLGEDETLLDHCTGSVFSQLVQQGSGWIALSRSGLAAHPRALRLRLYRRALQDLRGSLQLYELRHFMLLDDLQQHNRTGAVLTLPDDTEAVLTGSHLLLAPHAVLHLPPLQPTTLPGPGLFDLGNGLSLTIAVTDAPPDWQQLPSTTCFVAPELAPFPWTVRTYTAGERLDLLGMQGSRRIQDILTDLKIPRYLRAGLPLICHGSQPLWLAGIRRTRHALVSAASTQHLQITLCGTEKLPLFI